MRNNPPKVPVLLTVFNRPNHTVRVLNAIKEAKPSKLYVHADSPQSNNPENLSLRDECLQLIRDGEFDFPVEIRVADEPLGCGRGVSSALSWFFLHEEMGIILEDDTLPSPDFFPFAQELLDRYKDDERIGVICGNNSNGQDSSNTYFFSKSRSSWGWATWRRAWDNYDFDLGALDSAQSKDILHNLADTKIYRKIWRDRFSKVTSGEIDTWDWQWQLTLTAQNQLACFPGANLVTNIGFGPEATHTRSAPPDGVLDAGKLEWPLEHPKYVVPVANFGRDPHQVLGFALIRTLPAKVVRLLRKKLGFT